MTTMTADRKIALCRVHFKKLSGGVSLSAVSEIFSRRKSASILGGNAAVSRFSYWMAEPREIFEFKDGEKNPFEKLQKILTKYKMDSCLHGNDPSSLKLRRAGVFCGGWVGYFGYELGRYIERLPQTTTDDLKMPLIRLCFYDKLICYDHIENNWRLIAIELPDDCEEAAEKLAKLEKILEQSQEIHVEPPRAGNLEETDFSQVRCNISREYYLETIDKIRRYIYDGEVYQVNFSQRFECDYKSQPIELYHWQNLYNPSPYAAYIGGGDFYIVSASPEMFITATDGVIRTKPIKGTRSRSNDAKTNERNFRELLHSEKEQAELNMIIDLERNDLTRICKYGTIKVSQPRTIESYPTVLHAVATIEGHLREDASFCDILRAMFPGGSITGAPKIRAMQIINETEPTARGVYTGSIGYLGLDGGISLNIAIRTIIIKNKTAYAQTGGGIVADSDPQAEYDETITKARALLAGIAAVNR